MEKFKRVNWVQRLALVGAFSLICMSAAYASDPVYGSTEADTAVTVLTAIKTYILPLVGAVVSFFIVMKWLKRGSSRAS